MASRRAHVTGPRSIRRALCTIAAATSVLLIAAAPAVADQWTDISDAQWVSVYKVTAQEADAVADGYPDGTFRPYQAVTRGQFSKMAVDGLGVDTAEPAIPSFTDVPSTHIFYMYIEGGTVAGIMGGYPDGAFRPDQEITRQQGNSILGRYLSDAEIEVRGGIEGDVRTYPTLAAWYEWEGAYYLTRFQDQAQIALVHRPATAYLVFREVVAGNNESLMPTQSLSRAQSVALVFRTLVAVGEFTIPPGAPTDLGVVPDGPSNDERPRVTGHTIPDGIVAIYDTFAGAATEVAQGTADSGGDFSVRVPKVGLPQLSDGLHGFTAKVKDEHGLISPASAPVTYLLDRVPPEGTIIAPQDGGGSMSAKPDFTVSATDAGAGVESVTFAYRAAGSTADFTEVSTDSTPTDGVYQATWGDRSLVDGAYEFKAMITDLAGNRTILGPIDMSVDRRAPTVDIQAPTATGVFYTETRTPLFAASADDPPASGTTTASGVARVDFRYRLKSELPADPAQWKATDLTLLSSDDAAGYSADWGTTPLVDGRYVFAVQSIDRAGNASALDLQEVVVDNAPPVVALTAPAAAQSLSDNTPFTITWTLTDVAGVDTVKIEYSANNGDTWTEAAAAAPTATGQYVWSVPDIVIASVPTYKLRLTAVDRAATPVGDLPGHSTVLISSAFTVAEAPAPAAAPTASDSDTDPGIDGRDFHATWQRSPSTDSASQSIYILPAATTLDLATHTAVVSVLPAVLDWTGPAGLTKDSTLTTFASDTAYKLYVVTVDSAGKMTASVGAAITPMDAPFAPTGVVATDADGTTGVTGLDLKVDWTTSASPDVAGQRIYVLPAAAPLVLSGPGAHTPFVTDLGAVLVTYTGVAQTTDSAGAALVAGGFSVYVVAVDDTGKMTASVAGALTLVDP